MSIIKRKSADHFDETPIKETSTDKAPGKRNNKLKLIIPVALVLFVAILAVGATYTPSAEKEPDGVSVLGYYNYSMSTPTSWVYQGTTYNVDTSAGTAVVVKIEMKNVGESVQSNLIASDFRLDYEGMRYTAVPPFTTPYPGLPGIFLYTSYGPGTQGYDIAIFNLPPGGVDLSKASLAYVGKYNVVYDPTFKL